MNTEDIKKPEFLSLAQAAKAMGVSYHTLFRALHSGRIKGVNIAKSGTKPIWGFRPEDIQAYYDSLQNSNFAPKEVNE